MSAASSVEWREVDGRRCLAIDFIGKLSAELARTTLAQVRDAFDEHGDHVTMIWNAARMTGYETDARALWQEGMAELKPRIQAIHLVAESAIIRMGAAVVGMFIQYPIQTWPTLDAIRHDTAK